MSAEPQTGLLVVEDDAMVVAWVRLAVEASGFRLAGVASGMPEALELVGRRRPEVLLVDYHLADGTGTQLVRELRRRGLRAPALVMTSAPLRGLNETAREAGAQGTILKTGAAGELLRALRRVAAGETSFDPRHPRRGGIVMPSPREREILRLIADGATNVEAARAIGVGPETVKTLLGRTYAKLGVRGRTEAVVVAGRLGLL